MIAIKLLLLICLLLVLACVCAADPAGLTVPASTAYFQPDIEPAGTDVSVAHGVTGWADSKDQVVWYGSLGAGTLTVDLSLHLTASAVSHLRLGIAGQNRDVTVTGTGER